MVKDKKPTRISSDYPVFAVRIDQAIKSELVEEIESVRSHLNVKKRKKKDGADYWLKNDVVVEALREGLKVLKKR